MIEMLLNRYKKIDEFLNGVKSVAIAGHISPDGDCIGACMALWIYIRDNFPKIKANVYMQEIPDIYKFIEGTDRLISSCKAKDAEKYDVLFLLDISSVDRIGIAGPIYENAATTVCIDHHRTNSGQYTHFFNYPNKSSTCEALYYFFDADKISKQCAEALYMGIAHDTGVFRYPSTTSETMLIVSLLMAKGIDFPTIIEKTFFQKTYLQQKILGRILTNSVLYSDGRIMIGSLNKKEREEMGAKASDLEGIVSQLRNTKDVEVAVLLYELEGGEFKASFRSKEIVDVSALCMRFGGGGHIRAAGCKIKGTLNEITADLVSLIEKELKG